MKAPTAYDQMKSDLVHWGNWSRHCVVGIGYKSSSIEYQIMRGEIFGSGNHNSGRNPNHGTTFKTDEIAERIDLWVKLLTRKCPQECSVLKMAYIMQWSDRKIAEKLSISRSGVSKLKERGITLLLGIEASQAKPRP